MALISSSSEKNEGCKFNQLPFVSVSSDGRTGHGLLTWPDHIHLKGIQLFMETENNKHGGYFYTDQHLRTEKAV